jgi:glycosyltransferase involved in cell wall biosynthesis
MSDNPLITIITSTFNSEKTLKRCLDSVNNQSYPFIEHIIIDGNSTDATKKIIEKYASKSGSRISFWLSEPDSGVYDAWNKALPHIKGDWVCFLGSDDYYADSWVMENVSKQLIYIPKEIPIAYGKVSVFDPVTSDIIYTHGTSWKRAKKSFYRGLCVPHPGTFHRSNIFKNCGFFNTNYPIAADYDMQLRALKNHNAIFIDHLIVMMQFGGCSSDPHNSLNAAKEIRDILADNQCLSILYLFQYYTFLFSSYLFPKSSQRLAMIVRSNLKT